MKADFNTVLGQVIKEVWANIEAKHGPLRGEFKQECRPIIENDLRDCYSQGDPDGVADVVNSAERTIDDYISKAEVYMRSKYPYFNQQNTTEGKKQIPQKTYRKCLERRIHMLDFCFEFISDFPPIRPNWSKIAALWNEKHPFDKMTPDTLKAAFSKARHDKQAMLNWSLTQIGEFEVTWTGRTDKKQSITVQAPDTRHLTVKQPKVQGVEYDEATKTWKPVIK